MPATLRKHIAANIRLLISRKESISAVAAALKINRQQLNKYLNASTLPSLFILKQFADFFGVTLDDLLLEPQEFKRRHTQKRTWGTDLPLPENFRQDLSKLLAKQRTLDDYPDISGDYFIFCCNDKRRGIAKCVTTITRQDGIYAARTRYNFNNLTPDRSPNYRETEELVLIDQGKIVIAGPPTEDPLCRGWIGLFYAERFSPPRHFVGGIITSAVNRGNPILHASAIMQYIGPPDTHSQEPHDCGVFSWDEDEISEYHKRMMELPLSVDAPLRPLGGE
ncbi:helix-turn-helix domain-containing protein [Tritonibacter mobilis]|uniref:helix-turn-helix domain-containing protein n=1 Tax=Tritonibacter mobilis TaxID=379347 RepID=UPI000E0D8108|nr:helix-turn-helix transcriptional regulator [Tritonibacter mobilis]